MPYDVPPTGTGQAAPLTQGQVNFSGDAQGRTQGQAPGTPAGQVSGIAAIGTQEVFGFPTVGPPPVPRIAAFESDAFQDEGYQVNLTRVFQQNAFQEGPEIDPNDPLPTGQMFGFATGSPQFIISSYSAGPPSDFAGTATHAAAIGAKVFRSDFQTGSSSAYAQLAIQADLNGILMTTVLTDHIKAGHTVAQIQAYTADLMTQVANDVYPLPRAVELGNEPNGPQYGGTPNATEYVTLAGAASDLIRGDSNWDDVEIICAGISALGTGGEPTQVNAVTFLNSIIAAGIDAKVDSYAYHSENESFSWASQRLLMRQALINAGLGAKKLHITECDLHTLPGISGDATTDLTEAQQATRVTNRIADAKAAKSWMGDLYVYSIRDKNTGTASAEDNYGLYSTTWVAKQAAAAFAAAVA